MGAKKITICGKVQNVGYRLFLLEKADELTIERMEAKNTRIDGKEALIVLVDGEKEQIEEFVEFVKVEKPEKAIVEEIRVEDYDKKVRDIEKFRASFNTSQLSKFVQIGLQVVEKQHETIEVIKGESQKTRQELGAKIDRVGEIVVEESQKTRQELGAKIDRVGEI
ncbi:MAG: acylphosphatase, partial [Methanobacteriota archaeon]